MFNLFKKKEKLTIQDEVFGKIILNELKDENRNFFYGHVDFSSNDKNIEVFIKTKNKDLPTNEQRDFYKKLQSGYPEISEKIKKIFESELKIADFKLVSIDVPYFVNSPLVWEMNFESSADEDHMFTVVFEDFEPQNGIVVDG